MINDINDRKIMEVGNKLLDVLALHEKFIETNCQIQIGFEKFKIALKPIERNTVLNKLYSNMKSFSVGDGRNLDKLKTSFDNNVHSSNIRIYLLSSLNQLNIKWADLIEFFEHDVLIKKLLKPKKCLTMI